MTQFYRKIPDSNYGLQRVSIHSPKGTEEDSGIRLYSTQTGESWGLQVRGFYQTDRGKKGAKWYYAHASLRVDDIRALRDACDDALKEADEARS